MSGALESADKGEDVGGGCCGGGAVIVGYLDYISFIGLGLGLGVRGRELLGCAFCTWWVLF